MSKEALYERSNEDGTLVTVQAFRWEGEIDELPAWIKDRLQKGTVRYVGGPAGALEIMTLGGPQLAHHSDFVVKEADGRIFASVPQAFEATYRLGDLDKPEIEREGRAVPPAFTGDERRAFAKAAAICELYAARQAARPGDLASVAKEAAALHLANQIRHMS